LIAEFDIYGIFVPALVIFAIIAFLRDRFPRATPPGPGRGLNSCFRR